MISTTSQSLPVSDPTFQIPTHTLLDSASFLTLRIRRVKCENSCSFFTTPGRRCSASLRMRRLNPYSLNTVSRSRYSAPPRGWRPGPCPFNTIPRFRYGASLRGLRSNDFPYGFISIEMGKIVAGSPSLTKPLLFYPGLRPAMLDNIGGVRRMPPYLKVSIHIYIPLTHLVALLWAQHLIFHDFLYKCHQIQEYRAVKDTPTGQNKSSFYHGTVKISCKYTWLHQILAT
jgi:hypothetical protein